MPASGSLPASIRVVMVHNRYRSAQPSGENLVVDQEAELLQAAGHEVVRYEQASDDIAGSSLLQRAQLPGRTVWSPEDRVRLETLLKQVRPDIVHVHNTFPLISPSILEACRTQAVPAVATLHNFRQMCANGQLLRNGEPCELCVGRVPWRGVVHHCYRDSMVASIPLAVGIQLHRSRHTWTDGVTLFIAVSEFLRGRFIAGGFPGERIRVKPNFVPRPQLRRQGAGSYFLYLGRLSPEKGVDLLLDAWLPELGQLLIVGDGPSRQQLEARAARHGDSVRFLGSQPRQRCMELLTGARALVVASRWYETFGLVVVEAYAHGVPAVAPALGVFPNLVDEGRSGLLFAPGRPEQLRARLFELADPQRSLQMGEEAYRRYESRYTPEQNIAELMEIYRDAIARRTADDRLPSRGGPS